MFRRSLVFALLFSCGALLSSCAVPNAADSLGPSVYEPPPMPSAKLGLPPAYRVFHDELVEYGDWTLIEPYGWCFRPDVNFVAWRPYQQGWWEPSDTYGWIWNSSEPFGWITYHYGAWFYDRFQGWVWQPGPVWGPAWVAWAQVDDYIGWAALAPATMADVGDVPGGTFQYVSAQQLAASNVSTQALYVTRLAGTRGTLRAIENLDRVHGAAFNRGPDFLMLQRMGVPVPQHVDAENFRRAALPDGLALPDEADLIDASRRLVDVAARELDRLRTDGVAPPPVGNTLQPGTGTPRIKPAPKPPAADPDSLRVKRPRTPRDPVAPKPRKRPAAEPDSTAR